MKKPIRAGRDASKQAASPQPQTQPAQAARQIDIAADILDESPAKAFEDWELNELGERRRAMKQASRLTYGPAEFKIVRLRECPVEDPLCDTPEKIAAFWQQHVATAAWFPDDAECFCVFLLNTRRRLIGYQMVSTGTLDSVLVHPRQVFRPAIVGSASVIVVAHNHPSGDVTPSEADLKVTRDLMKAAQWLKIELVDHIIMGAEAKGRKGYVSLRELGYLYLSPEDGRGWSAVLKKKERDRTRDAQKKEAEYSRLCTQVFLPRAADPATLQAAGFVIPPMGSEQQWLALDIRGPIDSLEFEKEGPALEWLRFRLGPEALVKPKVEECGVDAQGKSIFKLVADVPRASGDANDVLEPKVRKRYSGKSAGERRAVAEDFGRWASQLRASADIMERTA